MNILYNNLIIFKVITLLFLIILIINIRLDRFYIKVNINIFIKNKIYRLLINR